MLVGEPVIIVLIEYLKNGKFLTGSLTDNLISRVASASKKSQRDRMLFERWTREH